MNKTHFCKKTSTNGDSSLTRDDLKNIYLEKYDSLWSRILTTNFTKLITRGETTGYTLDNIWKLDDNYFSSWIVDNVLIPLRESPNAKLKNPGALRVLWQSFHPEWLINLSLIFLMKTCIVLIPFSIKFFLDWLENENNDRSNLEGIGWAFLIM
jgi:hypothetical protein